MRPDARGGEEGSKGGSLAKAKGEAEGEDRVRGGDRRVVRVTGKREDR